MMSSWRLSVLADRHRALGSSWKTGTAWAPPGPTTSLADEHEAIRTRPG
jgi:aminomethyltransferase